MPSRHNGGTGLTEQIRQPRRRQVDQWGSYMVHTSTQKTLAKRHVLLRTAGALSLSTLATAAIAQSDSGSAGESATGLEEIIVTATRRAESQQDVAVSVTAVSGKDIQDLNIFKFEDVAALAPGL